VLIKRGATLTGEDVVKIADNKQWHAMRARNTARNWQRLVLRLNPSSGAPSPYYAGRDSGKPVEDPSNCPWRLMELVSYCIDEHSAAEVADVLEEIYSALPRIDDPRATYEDNATRLFVEALASWLRRREDEDKTPKELRAKGPSPRGTPTSSIPVSPHARPRGSAMRKAKSAIRAGTAMDNMITLLEFDPANFAKVQADAAADVPGAAADRDYYGKFIASAARGDSDCPSCARPITTLGLVVTGECRVAGKGRQPKIQMSLMFCADCVASRSRTEIIRSWLEAMSQITGVPAHRAKISLPN
jgi:hypothetical protein